MCRLLAIVCVVVPLFVIGLAFALLSSLVVRVASVRRGRFWEGVVRVKGSAVSVRVGVCGRWLG